MKKEFKKGKLNPDGTVLEEGMSESMHELMVDIYNILEDVLTELKKP